MNKRLAIIIPAFKLQFFKHALESVANQTYKEFTLYIGDDASGENLKQVVDEFAGRINIIYHRFEKNLGSSDLIGQWTRSVALSDGEDYIWLFSDDDLMPAGAVESFYKIIEEKAEFDLFRFNLIIIDENGNLGNVSSDHPSVESADNFILKRLKGETLSSACEYIFSRRAYSDSGGFIKFPLAWASDDATWYKLGKDKGICLIPGDPVQWRLSGRNITSITKNNGTKFKASLLYFKWLENQGISESVGSLIPLGIIQQIIYLKINIFQFVVNCITIFQLTGTRKMLFVVNVLIKRRLKLFLNGESI
jgi:glycosyltransferase involved in cell wall biosynthesis